jgi:hypothetical protein
MKKKVYQTIFNQTQGNCMQACVATLLNKNLNDVPNFICLPDWRASMVSFFKSQGYELKKETYWCSDSYAQLRDHGINSVTPVDMKLDPDFSVDGVYMAVVFSPKFFKDGVYDGNLHQILCDGDCNIIHDPNPEYQGVVYPLSELLGSNGILYVDIIKKLTQNGK